MELQTSGACQQFVARDRGSRAMVALGCLDVASRSFTLTPGRMQMRVPATLPHSGDYGALVVQNSAVTASEIISPQMPPGHYKGENIRSVMVVPDGTTTGTNSAFGYYVRNDSDADAVGVFGTTVCNKNHASCWAENPTVSDHTTNGVDTSAFNFGRALVGSELDVQVTSRDTTVSGYNCTGSSGIQPKAATCFQVGHMLAANPARGIKWTYGLTVDNATSQVAMLVGADAVSGSAIGSMPMRFNIFDAAGVAQAVQVQATGLGGLNVTRTGWANGITLTSATAGAAPALQANGTDANVNLALSAKGTGQVVAQSPATFNGAATFANRLVAVQPIELPVYTVAKLPTCNGAARGKYAAVSDAASPAYNAALTGGGSVSVPAYCNGSAWTAH